MKLEFQKLEIVDFKCFTGTTILPLTNFQAGLHFLRGRNEFEPRLGSNGAGKSSVWDALCWCLFGKTPGGLRNPDIKPRQGKASTDVTCVLSIDGKTHTIQRTANPNRLWLNKAEVGQEEVEKLIGFNFDVFTHTVLLGQGQPLFFDLPPKTKMELFATVLDLERWERRAAVANTKASDLDDQERSLQSELASNLSSQEEVDISSKEAKARSVKWEKEQQDRVNSYEIEIQQHRQRLKQAQSSFDKAGAAYDVVVHTLDELRALTKKTTKYYSDLRSDYAIGEASIKISRSTLNTLQKQISELGQGGTCPTCGQSVKGTDLAKHQRELFKEASALTKEINAWPPAELTNDLGQAKVLLEDCERKEREYSAKEREERSVIETLTQTIADLKGSMAGLKASSNDRAREANPFAAQLQTHAKRLNELKADEADIKEEIIKLTRLMERTKFWVKGFKDVRLYVIDEVLSELELTTNAVLEEVGLVGWKVAYAIEKETKSGTIQRGLNVAIHSPTNKTPVRWESWSGGESQRLRIIGALALSEVLLNHAGVETNLEILDEPTQHLSAEGVRDCCDFLAARAKQLGRQCWYVDHQSVESARFASVVTVVKDKRGARIEYDCGNAPTVQKASANNTKT